MSSAKTGGVRCGNCQRRDCGTLDRQRYPSDDIEALAECLEATRLRAEKAEANYAFMVNRAADQKLDGYRELANKCAELEGERDLLRAQAIMFRAAVEQMSRDKDTLARVLEQAAGGLGIYPQDQQE